MTAPVTPTETVTVNDINVAYRRGGDDGQPVVLVHGLAEFKETWTEVQEGLHGVTSYAYDLRGHEDTELGEGDATLEQLSADLIGFLEATTGPAGCVGFSLGGTVVLHAAATRPDLVRKATVMGTSSVVGRGAAAFYAQRVEQVTTGSAADRIDLMIADTAAGLAGSSVDATALGRRRAQAIGDGAGYANAASAMAKLHEAPLTPLLGRIHIPVDVIGADQDTFCPRKAADILLEGLPSSRYHEVSPAGHLMTAEQPNQVVALLRQTTR